VQNKKIIIIGDDIRQATGVANILRPISLSLSKKYDIVQIAAGLDSEVEEDISETIGKITENDSVYFKIYGTEGYGTFEKLNSVIKKESADCIFLMTDPHKFDWLLNSDDSNKLDCPIFYYHVWDNDPNPYFLKSYYESCSTISCISKLTFNCVKSVCPDHPRVFYTPHGVDTTMFFKQPDNIIEKHRIDFLGKNYKFVLFFNGTNIPRKELTSVILGFNQFYDNLDKNDKSNVALLMHTNTESSRGIDLNKLLDDLYPDLPVLISNEVVSEKILNNMYNLSHCCINVASNEGFGLCTLESVATQTPIIVNKTGGLKDQINEEWTIAIEPDTRILKGTQKTSYIFSDHVNSNSVASAIMDVYKKKEFDMSSVSDFLQNKNFTTNQMVEAIGDQIDLTISTFNTSN